MRLLRVWLTVTVVLAAALLAVEAIAPLRPPSTPGPAATASAPASPTAAAASPPVSPAPPASPSPALGITVSKVAPLPSDPYYFDEGPLEEPRIMLFDSSATKPPIDVAKFDPVGAPASGPDVRTLSFGVSADGRVLIVARRVAEQRTIFSAIWPERGTGQALFDDASTTHTTPVVTGDGTRFAYARIGDAATTGIWIADVSERPSPKRLVASDPQFAGSPPQPVSWSPDGTRLAIRFGGAGGSMLAIVDVPSETTLDPRTNEFRGGTTVIAGPGFAIDWRMGERTLLIASSRNAFGGRSFVYAFDRTTKQSRELYVPSDGTIIGGAAWEPGRPRFFVHELVAVNSAVVWLRALDGGGTKAGEGAISKPWWSRDGSRLWTLGLGDDSVGLVRDLLSGDAVTYCKRSPGPPCT